MAAVLTCGPTAVLSHDSAASLWGILPQQRHASIHVSIPITHRRGRLGIVIHRRTTLTWAEVGRRDGIPITTPTRTLIDISGRLPTKRLEAAVNEADKLDLIDPEALRAALGEFSGQPGAAVVRRLLDRRTFSLTDSDLERRFLRLVRRAGLPRPETGCSVNGFKVDFHWPRIGLIVETDGLRYHRTPAQQARDRRRDQVHTAAGMTALRFTHSQVRFEAAFVVETLRNVIASLVQRSD
jgi:very-short-patch-repair endonuclease